MHLPDPAPAREQTPTHARHRRRRWATRGLAIGAAGAIILTAGLWAERREYGLLTDGIRRSMEVQTLGLRGAVAHHSFLPFTTARYPDVAALLAAPADAALLQQVNTYLAEVNRRTGSDALYLMDLQGRTLAASNWADPNGFVGQRYANRPYFIEARAGGSGRFYGVGKTTGIPGLFIAAPVRQGDAVIGVVAVKVSLQAIESAWAGVRDPVLLSDEHGVVFLGTPAAWLYRATRPLSAQELDWIVRHQQYGDRGQFPPLPWQVERSVGQAGYRVQVDGPASTGAPAGRYVAIDETLPDLGWTLTVMADLAPVTLARNLAWALTSLMMGVLLLGGLYWRLRERRFVEQGQARAELEIRVQSRTQELRSAHAFRKAMEDSLLVGMRARDLQGRIVYVNPALCDMVGYRADQLVGELPPYPYWHPEDLDQHWQASNEALSGRAALTGFESRLRHRDGHDVHTMVYTAPLVDAAGQHSGWMSSVVDISAQKQAESQQRELGAQLQHSARLASLGELASTLAHELNQPLMALASFAGAARAFADQGQHALLVASLADIQAQAQRAGQIVKRIRGFVKRQTRGVERCALDALVDSVLTLMQPELRLRQTRVSCRLPPDLPAVAGDRVLLEQVVLNLVLNSLQAMQGLAADRRTIEIDGGVADGSVWLRIADRGPGVAEAVVPRLFEPFFTTRDDGLGLGLNICRTIVESHRGRLGFAPRDGGGAVFTVHLPTDPPDDPPTP